MSIIAIDPGTEKSAIVEWDGYWNKIRYKDILKNEDVIGWLAIRSQDAEDDPCQHIDAVHIEMIASYGMSVGREVFETCVFIGRLYQAWLHKNPTAPKLTFRRDIKLHHCASPRAKDANIRQSIIDRFGGKEKAIGRKKAPGPLYGVKSHLWAALALAIFAYDTPTTPQPKEI